MYRRTPLLSLIALALLAAMAGCAGNPADGKPEAVVEEAAPTAAAGHGQRFVISPESTIGFVGSKVTGSHEGGFSSFSGEIVVADTIENSSVDVTIDATSLWSDDDRLTGHLKSADFFEVETYPQARFSSTAIAAAGSGYSITGNLELHGVTKSITFPATIVVAGDSVTASAEFSVMRFDFGLTYPGKADDLIRDEVVIKFDLIAAPAS